MTTFLTYSIYSMSTSSTIPAQSDYVPAITVFYIMSTMYTLLAFSWFVLENFLRSRGHLPFLARKWVDLGRLIETCAVLAVKKVRISKKVRAEETRREVKAGPAEQAILDYFQAKKKVCSGCETCHKCEEKTSKENENKKKKQALDADIDYLNHQVFWIVLTSIFMSNLMIWGYLGSAFSY
jgi:hypothetical protein